MLNGGDADHLHAGFLGRERNVEDYGVHAGV